LQETKSHPTADRIYQQLKDEIPSLSLGTVYRNLNVLIEQGLVQRIPFGSGQDRFEARIEPHYHLVCEKCGKVTDLSLPHYSEINEHAQRVSGFKVNRHRIDFFGICKECRNTTTTTPPKRKGK
jgi:Fe2+ or Zn2+ uptake regulation protein